MASPLPPSSDLLAQVTDLNARAEQRLRINPRETVELAGRALELARSTNLRQTQPRSLFLKGTASVALARFEDAEQTLGEAVGLAEELGQPELQFRCVNGLGTIAHTRGQYGKAFGQYHRYLAYARSANDRNAEVRALGNIGMLYFEMGELPRALEIGRKVLSIAELTGNTLACAVSAMNVAEPELLLGKYELALDVAAHWRPLAAEHGFEVQATMLQGLEGAAKLALGRHAEALIDLEAAVSAARTQGDVLESCGILISLGEAYIALGRLSEAEAPLKEAFERTRAAASVALELRAARVLLLFYEARKMPAQALEFAHSVIRLQEHIHQERLSRRTEVLAVEFEIDQLRSQADLERQKTEALEQSNALLKRLQENLQHEATHDALTGLYNRRHFLELLETTLADCRTEERRFGIAYLDLDEFKPVNDTYGHTAGDALLVELARRLAEATRSKDVLARLGGDEFAVIIVDIKEPHDAERKAQRLANALRKPVQWEGVKLQCSVSIGVATFPEHGTTATELLHQADSAMYKNKRQRVLQR